MGILDFFGGGAGPKYKSPKQGFEDFGGEMDRAAQRYQGNVDVGNRARDMSMGEYQKLIQNPNFLQDQISEGFYKSPYQKYMQDMTQKRMNQNSATTGMLGSGAANRALTQELTNMTGQFQNDYINRGMGSYGQGLSGLSGLTDLGLKSMGAQDQFIESGAAGRLKGFLGEQESNQRNAENEYNARNRGIGNLIGFGGGLISGLSGGGGGIGGIGSSIAGMFGGGGGGAGGGAGGGYGGMGSSTGSFLRGMFGGGGGGNTVRPGLQGGGMQQPQQQNYNVGSWSY